MYLNDKESPPPYDEVAPNRTGSQGAHVNDSVYEETIDNGTDMSRYLEANEENRQGNSHESKWSKERKDFLDKFSGGGTKPGGTSSLIDLMRRNKCDT